MKRRNRFLGNNASLTFHTPMVASEHSQPLSFRIEFDSGDPAVWLEQNFPDLAEVFERPEPEPEPDRNQDGNDDVAISAPRRSIRRITATQDSMLNSELIRQVTTAAAAAAEVNLSNDLASEEEAAYATEMAIAPSPAEALPAIDAGIDSALSQLNANLNVADIGRTNVVEVPQSMDNVIIDTLCHANPHISFFRRAREGQISSPIATATL